MDTGATGMTMTSGALTTGMTMDTGTTGMTMDTGAGWRNRGTRTSGLQIVLGH